MKSRRAAAAQALWGPDVAGQRLDNTPLHLAVAAYINEAAKRRVAEKVKKRAEGGDSDGDDDEAAEDDSALNENERFDTPRSVGVDGTCTRGRWTRASRAPGRWPR